MTTLATTRPTVADLTPAQMDLLLHVVAAEGVPADAPTADLVLLLIHARRRVEALRRGALDRARRADAARKRAMHGHKPRGTSAAQVVASLVHDAPSSLRGDALEAWLLTRIREAGAPVPSARSALRLLRRARAGRHVMTRPDPRTASQHQRQISCAAQEPA